MSSPEKDDYVNSVVKSVFNSPGAKIFIGSFALLSILSLVQILTFKKSNYQLPEGAYAIILIMTQHILSCIISLAALITFICIGNAVKHNKLNNNYISICKVILWVDAGRILIEFLQFMKNGASFIKSFALTLAFAYFIFIIFYLLKTVHTDYTDNNIRGIPKFTIYSLAALLLIQSAYLRFLLYDVSEVTDIYDILMLLIMSFVYFSIILLIKKYNEREPE